MSDYQDRLHEAREEDAARALRRRVQRINAGNRRRAAHLDAPPAHICVVCGVDIDTCKCENGE